MQRTALLALLTFTIATPAIAQRRPDLSGTWSLPPDAPLGANGKPIASSLGPQFTIKQDAATITLSRLLGPQTVYITHPLDGSETRSSVPGRLCQADVSYLWTTVWEDGAVVVTQVGSLPAGAEKMTPMGVKTALRPAGPDALNVEITFQNPGMAEPVTRTTRYVRSGPPAAIPAPPAAAPVQATISQLAWLGGTWIGTTTTGAFEERWTPPAGGSMQAVARTLNNGTLRGFEFLCIVERHGGLVYQAMPNGRQPATDFVMTKLDATSATFENPANSFPKRIRYTLGADGTLEAVISGTEKQKPRTFKFKKDR
jgi:hypothetical protein